MIFFLELSIYVQYFMIFLAILRIEEIVKILQLYMRFCLIGLGNH